MMVRINRLIAQDKRLQQSEELMHPADFLQR